MIQKAFKHSSCPFLVGVPVGRIGPRAQPCASSPPKEFNPPALYRTSTTLPIFAADRHREGSPWRALLEAV